MMNHFELFGLAETYNVDLAELQQRYRKLQQALHPDRFASASERDKLLAVQRTAQLNDAYQSLRNPIARAEYLLSLRGVDMQHEQKTLQDPEFLMAQMEWRERLETLSGDDFVAMDAAYQELAAQTQELQQALEEDLSAAANESAAETVRKLKFMAKLRQELEEIEDNAL